MDIPPDFPPDLPIEHQARAALSPALRLHAEGRTDEANLIFNTLGRQVRRAGPTALLIEGDAVDDADTARNLEVLVTLMQACAEEVSEARPGEA